MFNLVLDTIRSIWDVMTDTFVITFGGYTITLGNFLIALIITGVILSIFMSFVNINNVRSSFSLAELNNTRERHKAERRAERNKRK